MRENNRRLINLFWRSTGDLGIREKTREWDKLILDLLGWKLYNQYRQDNAEILAYAFEESLYGSYNILVKSIIEQLLLEAGK